MILTCPKSQPPISILITVPARQKERGKESSMRWVPKNTKCYTKDITDVFSFTLCARPMRCIVTHISVFTLQTRFWELKWSLAPNLIVITFRNKIQVLGLLRSWCVFVYTIHTEPIGKAIGKERLEFQGCIFLRYVLCLFVFFSKDSIFMAWHEFMEMELQGIYTCREHKLHLQ